jgi:hypothetical protein
VPPTHTNIHHRRVKCDEEKPACHRCRRLGRQCAGYSVPKPWLFEPGKRSSQPDQDDVQDNGSGTDSSDDSWRSPEHITTDRHMARQHLEAEIPSIMSQHQRPGLVLPRHIPIIIGQTPYERRAFQMYVELGPAILEVADGGDYEFLVKTIPQACHTENALLRAAILCITSHFISMADPQQRDLHCLVSEFQYLKIIKSMVYSKLEPQPWPTNIILCIFLVIIEGEFITTIDDSLARCFQSD